MTIIREELENAIDILKAQIDLCFNKGELVLASYLVTAVNKAKYDLNALDGQEQSLTLSQDGWDIGVEPGFIDGTYLFISKQGKDGFIQIKADEEGFAVDIYDEEANITGSDPIASTYAFYNQLTGE